MFSLLLSSFLFKGLTDIIQGGGQFASQQFLTENLLAPKLKVFKNTGTQPGYLFYAITGSSWQSTASPAPLIMDNSGEVVWFGPELYSHNFRAQSYQGSDVVTYWSGFGDKFGHGYGNITVMDNTYRTLHEVCLEGNFVTPNPDSYPGTRTKPCYFDGHESYITDRGTIIGTAYNVTRADLREFNGPKNGWVFDAQFYEVDMKTNKVLFRWSALEHIPLRMSNYKGDDSNNPLIIGQKTYGNDQQYPWDFFHINSVHPVEGGYIVNSRMTWSFYKINNSGGVDWTLEGSSGGDFSLGEGIFFSWQHMPRLISTSGDHSIISVFNNDNINSLLPKMNQSTGYALDLNTKDMTVKVLRNLRDDANVVYAGAEGSYQALPGAHALLGYGSIAVIKEFDGKGEVVYDAQFAPIVYQNSDQDHGKDVHSYRAYRYEWNAEPHYPPKVAAFDSTPDGSIYVYMSWNGATGYDSWNIYAGDNENSMQKVASGVHKTGFETMHVLKGATMKKKMFQVEALGSGKSLRNSTTVRVRSDI